MNRVNRIKCESPASPHFPAQTLAWEGNEMGTPPPHFHLCADWSPQGLWPGGCGAGESFQQDLPSPFPFLEWLGIRGIWGDSGILQSRLNERPDNLNWAPFLSTDCSCLSKVTALCKVTNGSSFVPLHVCDTVHLSFFQSLALITVLYRTLRVFVRSEGDAQPPGNSWKAVGAEVPFCWDGTKRKKWKGSGCLGGPDCLPLPQSQRPDFWHPSCLH